MVTVLRPTFVPDISSRFDVPSYVGMSREEQKRIDGRNMSPKVCAIKSKERGSYLSQMRSILPSELSKLIVGDSDKRSDFVLIDCQSFMDYSSRHITGAFHVNCTGLVQRRLTQGKVKLQDLLPSEKGKEKFLEAKVTNRPVVVYDSATNPADMNTVSKPISLLTKTLLNEGTNTLILQGGIKEFLQKHQNLCESVRACQSRDRLIKEPLVGATSRTPIVGPTPPPTSEHDIGPAVSEIIPNLYIGNKCGASNQKLLDNLGVKYVLNVTKNHPNFFQHRPDLVYKQIFINDSSHEDIGEHFETALSFIEQGLSESKGVLVHCQAGISRSATMVIAFLMKHQKLTLNDAYKVVKEKRPVISPNLNFMGSLLKYEKTTLRR